MYQCTLAVTLQAAVHLCFAVVSYAAGAFPRPERWKNCLPTVLGWSPAQSSRDTQGSKYVPKPYCLSEQPFFLILTRFQPRSFPRALCCLTRQERNQIFLRTSVRNSNRSASRPYRPKSLLYDVKWPFAIM